MNKQITNNQHRNQFIQLKARGYKTQANAKRKMEQVIEEINRGSEKVTIRWVMTVNEEGRFLPTAVNPKGWVLTSLVHSGVCVVS